MVIADAIREAETAYVVYFLLEAYLNTASRREALKDLPARIVVLPLTGRHDTKSRFALLMRELDAASKRLDDAACTAIKEAITVFSAALQRLEFLERKLPRASLSAVAADACDNDSKEQPPYGYPSAAGPVPKASSQA